MNICSNHCSYLINFNYAIGLKENIDVVTRTSINMPCVWGYSNVDRYRCKRNHFYFIKVTGQLMSKKRNSCFDKSHDTLIDSHLCFEASQNTMPHIVFAPVLTYEIEVGKNWTNNETCFPIFWHEWSISPELWLIEAATVTGNGFNQSRIYSRMAISVHVLKLGRRSIL